jgi:hypothetical protein
MARDTQTGQVAENMLIPALKKGGYNASAQYFVGQKLNGRRHIVDYMVDKDGLRILVSKKWQQSGGTAEEKVPYEVICLMNACKKGYNRAFLVLGGTDADSERGLTGWTLRKFYVDGGLSEFIDYKKLVQIVTLEQFVSLANQGKL